MKLSLAWIFDHIQTDWRHCDVQNLVTRFNQTTAEIESCIPYKLELKHIAVGEVRDCTATTITLHIPEWKCDITLPARADAQINTWFLIKKDHDYQWATVKDFGSTKDGLFPRIHCPDPWQAGAWKKHLQTEDYILELNNTSVTHRPDLWGMRGIARECAALLKVPLKDIATLIKHHDVVTTTQKLHKTTSGWQIRNDAPSACSRFAVLPITTCQYRASSLLVATQLCRIDYRPINFIVDCTNYVMADLGQPLHAFDAQKITHQTLGPRLAPAEKSLTLLDGTTIKLNAQDVVISDTQTPLSLAGIMGGASSAIHTQTNSVAIEAANFDIATIRGSTAHHKIRTESSIRFEKGLDPNQNIIAIQRLLALFDQEHFSYQTTDPIISLGDVYQPNPIIFDTMFIDQRLGVTIPAEFVQETLTRIEFLVTEQNNKYHVNVPSFRGLNTITIPEDIVEEVARFWGYNNIAPTLPTWLMQPHDHHAVFQLRAIKNHLAYALAMHEVNNYPFFDEKFIQSIHYTPHDAIRAKNPLSQNMVQLVDSLVPHLLKNVQHNLHHSNRINFFEINRTWHLHNDISTERSMLAALWWNSEATGTFYDGKAALQSLFDMLRLPVQWCKATHLPNQPWFSQHQTAQIMYHDQLIGYAGMADSAFLQAIGKGNAFVCELDANMMCTYQTPIVTLKPLAKYPYIFYDISMLVPMTCTVQQLSTAIQQADNRIYDIQLIDIFEHVAWPDQRSITVRYYMRDNQKTLTTNDAQAINQLVIAQVKPLGAQIRS